MWWNKGLLLTAVLCAHGAWATPTTQEKHCQLPAAGEPFETATPEEVGLDAGKLQAAITYATTHNRFSLQIFRHNCRVAVSLPTFLTEGIQNNVWSCTKSVVSMLNGIANAQGHLNFTDPIGKYLPEGPGWGNPAHRAIRIIDLMTETSGLASAILAEGGTVGVDASAPQEALAQKLQHPPGTYFEYAQRVPDLLAYVISRAVGEDLQTYAQKYLFTPIGIEQNKYLWLRDRSGNTYGYAWLFLAPEDLARLGLLAQNGGSWNGEQIVPASYLYNASQPSPKNPCYGWLFWNNAGKPCTAANIPSAQTFDRYAIPAAPHDSYAMVGTAHQNNFMLPGLDMTVTWTGAFGDYALNLAELISAAPGPLYNNFFSLLMKAVTDAKVPHKGFLKEDPLDLDINPINYISPSVLIADLVSSPSCNVLFCNNTIPTQGLIENLQDIAILL